MAAGSSDERSSLPADYARAKQSTRHGIDVACRFRLLRPACGCAAGPRSSPVVAPDVGQSPVFDGQPGPTPPPPTDLDAQRVREYPLRGLALQESGRARVRFTVQASDHVSTSCVLSATRTEFGDACLYVGGVNAW